MLSLCTPYDLFMPYNTCFVNWFYEGSSYIVCCIFCGDFLECIEQVIHTDTCYAASLCNDVLPRMSMAALPVSVLHAEAFACRSGFRGTDEAYGMQPSSARASVASSEGYGPSSSRASRNNHEDSFGGGKPSSTLYPLRGEHQFMAMHPPQVVTLLSM